MGNAKISLSMPFVFMIYVGTILLVLGIISIMIPNLVALPQLIYIGVTLILAGLAAYAIFLYGMMSNVW